MCEMCCNVSLKDTKYLLFIILQLEYWLMGVVKSEFEVVFLSVILLSHLPWFLGCRSPVCFNPFFSPSDI